MKTHPRNHLFGYVRLAILGALVAVLVVAIGLVIHWRPVKTVERQQAAMIGAIEKRKGARFRRLLSNDYQDRWGFNVDDATNAMLDLRSQFMILAVNSEQQGIEIEGKTATLTTRLSLGGTPIGGGSQITQQINRLKDPWVFTWEKQSFLPSSWRLVKIENMSIPDNVWNYQPGSIQDMMEGN